MPRGRWAWVAEVWRAIVGDRQLLILLVVVLVLCAATLTLVLH